MKRKINKKGFTLVEILAAITIMGVLSGTAVAGIGGSLKTSHNEYCTSQSDMMTLAGRDYFNDNTSKLPAEIGAKAQIDLNTLITNKYIDSLKDYDSNLCNASTSKVNVIKATQSDYYYSTILDCNKCNSTDTGASLKESTPSISFTPDGRIATNSNANQDVTVTMNMADTENKIVSYRYEVYEKVAGKQDTMVNNIKQTLYKGEKITVKLNKKGTYYIKGYAINSYGNTGYKKSKDYTLKFTLDCEKQVGMSAVVNNSTATSDKWYNQNIEMKFSKKGAVEAYNVVMIKDGGGEQTLVSNRGTSYSKTLTDTGTYRFKVTAYDDQGTTCTKVMPGVYKIDKVAPTCTPTTATGNWTNQNVTLVGICSDSHSGCKQNTSNPITISQGQIFNSSRSAGTVVDNAGNSTQCASQVVKIDKQAPSCSVTYTGTPGNNGYFRSGVTGYFTGLSDGAGSGVTNYGMSFSGATDYSGATSIYYGANTNNAVRVYGFVRDAVGNVGSCNTGNSVFKIDYTPPSCTLYSSGTYGANGWYTSNVSIGFNQNYTGDTGSWIVASSITGAANPLTSDTKGVTYTGTVVDAAGNSAFCYTSVKRDTGYPTAPKIDRNYAITITNEANTSVGGILQNVYGNCDYACVQANRAYVDGSVNLQSYGDQCYTKFGCTTSGHDRYCYFLKRKNCGSWHITYDSSDTSGIAGHGKSSATERGTASGWGGKSDITDHVYYTVDGAGHASYLHLSVLNSYAWWPKNISRAQQLEAGSIYVIKDGKWKSK